MLDRLSFNEEFKAGAVELVTSFGRSVKDTASELGIKEGPLANWVRARKVEHPDAGTAEPGPVGWAKYKALQAENAALKKENDFRGKASVFFAAKQL